MQTGDIAELCRREGINPTQFYGWKKQLVGSADAVFNARDQKRSHKEIKLEHAHRRLQAVIAEITAENLELKKTLSD
jgi:transposase-like protein